RGTSCPGTYYGRSSARAAAADHDHRVWQVSDDLKAAGAADDYSAASHDGKTVCMETILEHVYAFCSRSRAGQIPAGIPRRPRFPGHATVRTRAGRITEVLSKEPSGQTQRATSVSLGTHMTRAGNSLR